MTRTEFFPYPVAERALKLDYRLQTDHAEAEANRILAVAVPETDSVGLELAIELDEENTYDRILPESERSVPPVEAVVVVHSISSRERRAVRLAAEADTWRGSLDLAKKDLYGQLELEPRLVRSVRGTDAAYAIHPGALIATGEAVTVEVDEPPVRAGGYLDIRFDDFRRSGNPKRSAHPELLYLLDTDPSTPILWLNEGIDGFKPVMFAKGPRGGNLRVRDAMYDTIVSQVWTALASISITELALVIADQHENDDDSDPVGSLSEWQQQVISFWAPHMFPGSREEAIEQVVETASDRRRLPELFDGLGYAIQEVARTHQAFRGLLRLRDREGV